MMQGILAALISSCVAVAQGAAQDTVRLDLTRNQAVQAVQTWVTGVNPELYGFPNGAFTQCYSQYRPLSPGAFTVELAFLSPVVEGYVLGRAVPAPYHDVDKYYPDLFVAIPVSDPTACIDFGTHRDSLVRVPDRIASVSDLQRLVQAMLLYTMCDPALGVQFLAVLNEPSDIVAAIRDRSSMLEAVRSNSTNRVVRAKDIVYRVWCPNSEGSDEDRELPIPLFVSSPSARISDQESLLSIFLVTSAGRLRREYQVAHYTVAFERGRLRNMHKEVLLEWPRLESAEAWVDSLTSLVRTE